MQRVNSEVIRCNHHSLNKKTHPYSLQSSNASSVVKNRKMSMNSFKENFPDLQKLIKDVKISQNCPKNSNEGNIKKIVEALNELQANDELKDDVRIMKNILKTVSSKLNKEDKNKLMASTGIKITQISPIKQISQDSSSRIVYTNFSLKDIESNVKCEQTNKFCKGTKVTVSKFQQIQGIQNNHQVDRLNAQINYLQSLLQKKTGISSKQGLFKKRSAKY